MGVKSCPASGSSSSLSLRKKSCFFCSRERSAGKGMNCQIVSVSAGKSEFGSGSGIVIHNQHSEGRTPESVPDQPGAVSQSDTACQVDDGHVAGIADGSFR